MPTFGHDSEYQLLTCDPRIQKVFREVIKYFDCKIIEGHRGQASQHRAFMDGKSELDWPKGKHNKVPSDAVDAMPFPIDWKDDKRICYFAGFVMATAVQFGIKMRWGHDWDGDTDLRDQTFNDSCHFELIT
jgi:peptidoglycan L-alanyl-D-glutamate endopeptidase CwlK